MNSGIESPKNPTIVKNNQLLNIVLEQICLLV